jgi:hypothetical protein
MSDVGSPALVLLRSYDSRDSGLFEQDRRFRRESMSAVVERESERIASEASTLVRARFRVRVVIAAQIYFAIVMLLVSLSDRWFVPRFFYEAAFAWQIFPALLSIPVAPIAVWAICFLAQETWWRSSIAILASIPMSFATTYMLLPTCM